jgi:hypothetical protein
MRMLLPVVKNNFEIQANVMVKRRVFVTLKQASIKHLDVLTSNRLQM